MDHETVAHDDDRGDELLDDVTFVLIVSKLCNLRCRYCYEYPDLANRRRMTLPELGRVFEVVATHYAGAPRMRIRFAWQGGEPLLHEPAYFRDALALQARAFAGSGHRLMNVMQTNLTVLDDERIALLAAHFDGVGVSHDVVGGLRVDAGGRTRDDRTVANLDRLITAHVPIGGITVLTRQNADHLDEVYDFWRRRSLPFRLLPMHRGPFSQADDFALTPDEVRRAFCRCVDLWLDDPEARSITPVTDLVGSVFRAAAPGVGTMLAYDKNRREHVFIVDTTGAVGGVNDLLDLAHAYGNIFESTLAELLASPGHQRAAARAAAAIEASCTSCPFFRRSCDGHPMGEGAKDFSEKDARGAVVCTVTRGTLTHIRKRLWRRGAIDLATSAPEAPRGPSTTEGRM